MNQKMEFECEAVDTLKLCRKLMPEQEKKNLGNACIYYKIEQPLTHRAEADALFGAFALSEVKGTSWRRPARVICDNAFKLPDEATAAGNEKTKRILAGFIKMS